MSTAIDIEQVERRFQQILANPRSVAAYAALTAAREGKVLDVDIARLLCPEYAAGKEGHRRWTGATGRPATEFIKKLYSQKLKLEPAGPVLFLAGGGGSGKSTVADNLLAPALVEAEIVWDGTFGNYEAAHMRIQAALKSHREVMLCYVHRPFEAAVAGVGVRYEKLGRWVPALMLAKDHAGAQDSIARLQADFRDDDRVEFMAIDNTEVATQIPMECLADLRYDTAGEGVEATARRLYPIAKKGLPYDY